MSWSPGGMGLALYNALLRPAVRRVTVVERDPEVIDLFDAMRGAEWPFLNRPAIERGNALMWCSCEPVDYLFADIWDRLGSPEAAADMRTMCRNLRPKAAGFWAIEANFVSFLVRNQCKPPVTQLQFRPGCASLRRRPLSTDILPGCRGFLMSPPS